MEPLFLGLLPGLLGGLALALVIAKTRRRPPSVIVPRRLEFPIPEAINMAHIKVEGIGGLGLVAAVIAVAVTDPRIRAVTLAAALLGAGLAFLLIRYRRAAAEASSDGDGSADRSTLHLEGDRRARLVNRTPPRDSVERLGAAAC